MAATSGIEKLQGTWEYVDGEHFDDYMKELVGRFFFSYNSIWIFV